MTETELTRVLEREEAYQRQQEEIERLRRLAAVAGGLLMD
jgi:hypothetical protein